jgi:hypothetical protein
MKLELEDGTNRKAVRVVESVKQQFFTMWGEL